MKNSEYNYGKEIVEKLLISNGWDSDDASHAAMIIFNACVRSLGAGEFKFNDGSGSQVNDETYFKVLGAAVSLSNRDDVTAFDGEPEDFMNLISENLKWGRV